MKWNRIFIAMTIVAVSASVAQADLLSRFERAIAPSNQVESPTPAPALGSEETIVPSEDAAIAEEQVILHEGYGQTGCCQPSVGYAKSLWAGFCCKSPKPCRQRCHKPRCRKPRCCKKVRTCWKPNFDLSWLHRCCRPQRGCGHHRLMSWVHAGWGCNSCSNGCSDSMGGEIWHDVPTPEMPTPPMPETVKPDGTKSISLDRAAHNWLLRLQLRLSPVSVR